jgi:predicted metal-dependent peptidase
VLLFEVDAEPPHDGVSLGLELAGQKPAISGYRINGFGGSDLTPALLTLAADPLVTACVVITDGDIAYPPAEMPYAVLWVLPTPGNPGFRPPYGHVVTMQQGGLS